MQCVIVAGGKGTRLKEILGDLPKPMVTIGSFPLLEHQILLAKEHGIDNVLILTGYGAEHIEQYFGKGSQLGIRIEYQREAEPLGTAGAVLNAWSQLEDVFFVMYGDTMLSVDLSRMLSTHPVTADMSLFLHPNRHPFDSDLVEVDEANWVRAVHPYPHPEGCSYRNLVNAALYVCRKSALNNFPRGHALDFGKHVFPTMVQRGKKLYGYISSEYIRDAGTPDRLAQVREDYRKGRIRRGPRPAIFLDRDGTLNHERNWLRRAEDLQLLPFAGEGVRQINEAGYLAIVITNQPVIARGECTEQEMRRIHDKLEWLLGLDHAYLDAIYLCPHHPDQGFLGERAHLKGPCSCRKPAVGLFEKALQDLEIDLSQSWMIGDRASDIEAAKALGIRSVFIGSRDPAPRHHATAGAGTLKAAMDLICGNVKP